MKDAQPGQRVISEEADVASGGSRKVDPKPEGNLARWSQSLEPLASSGEPGTRSGYRPL